ncbi:hypothetical protein H9P43_008457 [Blastocladiella emersonii ATCC 22665]|nr:hypothetical protein H9P43_008457 [Blastocladiella emersonii ATCC 22665]
MQRAQSSSPSKFDEPAEGNQPAPLLTITVERLAQALQYGRIPRPVLAALSENQCALLVKHQVLRYLTVPQLARVEACNPLLETLTDALWESHWDNLAADHPQSCDAVIAAVEREGDDVEVSFKELFLRWRRAGEARKKRVADRIASSRTSASTPSAAPARAGTGTGARGSRAPPPDPPATQRRQVQVVSRAEAARRVPSLTSGAWRGSETPGLVDKLRAKVRRTSAQRSPGVGHGVVTATAAIPPLPIARKVTVPPKLPIRETAPPRPAPKRAADGTLTTTMRAPEDVLAARVKARLQERREREAAEAAKTTKQWRSAAARAEAAGPASARVVLSSQIAMGRDGKAGDALWRALSGGLP